MAMARMMNAEEQIKLEEKMENRFGGVYLLFDKGVCVYVGQSANVPKRLDTHIKERRKVFDDFRFISCEDRMRMESELIRILKPKYNITGNSGNERWLTKNEQDARCWDEISKVIDILERKMADNPFACRWNDIDWMFGNIVSKKVFIDVVSRYRGYIGKDNRGEDLFNLEIIIQFQEAIQVDLDRDAHESLYSDHTLPAEKSEFFDKAKAIIMAKIEAGQCRKSYAAKVQGYLL